mmetsp:Transcript_12106/g.20064  ORF Transcript_12106/g.20064 Transcript_12106/m.20064 type:complete len:102 (-) Transcript_12106:53-358(-)
MKKYNHHPSSMACSMLINSTRKERNWQAVSRILAIMRKLDVKPTSDVLGDAIMAYHHSGQWDQALKMLNRIKKLMPGMKIPINVEYLFESATTTHQNGMRA